MLTSTGVPRSKLPFLTLLVGSVLVLGTCTDGEGPAGVPEASQVRLALAARLSPELAPGGMRAIEQIRVTVTEVSSGAVLASQVLEVDPGSTEWDMDLSIPLTGTSSVTVLLSVELLSFSTGSELVEWSGRVGPLTLQVGRPLVIEDVPFIRGPLANLSVSGLNIQDPSGPIREGESLQLVANYQTTTPSDPPTIFWSSLNPGVATVSGTGLVEGVIPGLARVAATAGSKSDTITVTVLQRPASVAVSPDAATLNALGDQILFEAQVLDPRGDPLEGEGVTWEAGNSSILQDLGGGRFESKSRGTTTVTAKAILDPTVSGSAQVLVRQVVAAVEVLPEEPDPVFPGGTRQFQAVAYDGNENTIDGMGFSWRTSDSGVATISQEGLATGVAGGTVTIQAETVSEVLAPGEDSSGAPTPGTIGSATLEVLPEVVRVVLNPGTFTFRSLGQTQKFTAQAFGMDEDGLPNRLLPLTDFTWTSANPLVVRIDSTGLTADTVFTRGLANGNTVIRATVRGVTGSASVFVSQTIASISVTPDPWEFVPIVGTGAYETREFRARAYDALNNLIPGVVFAWREDGGIGAECFPIQNTTDDRAVVSAQCGCGTAARVFASAGGVEGRARLSTPACGLFLGTCSGPEGLRDRPFRFAPRF